ncbi:MAG: serine hydrolase domain-containing protein [Pyramidobacter sp.]|uniref:serine hydrolase domain-containing protein n=1 Tax=Pyramidobacter sp. TaxID=1943581 RepID=UPI002A8145E8|nr:serine hydrolase domain-containing protein [Pyramidobacter sp.]MDY4031885.1 serine hydrolase domain-containing protein [Pyramidobacter sp.]
MTDFFQAQENSFSDYVERIMTAHRARGLAVAVVDRRGTVYQRFFGFRDAARRLTVGENTIFGLASVTKSFTALALMQLAEQGLVDLQAPASAYCPEFKNGGQAPVSVAHFLSHSGGYFPMPRALLPDLLKKLGVDPRSRETAYDDRVAQTAVEQVARGLDAPAPRLGRPGEYMSYCNDGYGILSDIVRRCGGEGSYARYVKRRILEPLGMSRSTCEFLRPSEDADTSLLYSDDLGVSEGDRDFYRSAFVLNGGGAMKSTLADLKKYLRMYLNGGRGEAGAIVSERSVRDMVRPRVPAKHHQFYGYGLSTNFMRDLTIHRHGGSLPGVSSHIAWSPELERGAIVLCNTQNVPVSLIADALLRIAAGWEPQPEDLWIDCPWEPEVIEAACGRYCSGEGAKVTIEKDGRGISVLNDGKAMSVRMVRGRMALLRSGFAVSELRPCFNENGAVWALRLNDRIVPKVG